MDRSEIESSSSASNDGVGDWKEALELDGTRRRG